MAFVLGVTPLVACGVMPSSGSTGFASGGNGSGSGPFVGNGGSSSGPDTTGQGSGSGGSGGNVGGPGGGDLNFAGGSGGAGSPQVGQGQGASGPSLLNPTSQSSASGPIFSTVSPVCDALLKAWVANKIGAPATLDCGPGLSNYTSFLNSQSYLPLIGSDGQGNTCMRDGDVVTAILECWAAYCDNGNPQVDIQTSYIQPAEQNLCNALQLCSNAPCVTGGTNPSCPVPCLTAGDPPSQVDIFPCPASGAPPPNGLTCP